MKNYAGEYVGALLLTTDGQLILQHRDNKPGIVYPDTLGVFGGGIEEGETPEVALARELGEELGMVIDSADLRRSKVYQQTIERHGSEQACHIFIIPDVNPEILTVSEGQGYVLVSRGDDRTKLKMSVLMRDIVEDYFASL